MTCFGKVVERRAAADEEAASQDSGRTSPNASATPSKSEVATTREPDNGGACQDAHHMHQASTVRRTLMRMPAILVTFVIELAVAFVISQYQGTFKRYPLLISFQPVISAISGNVGLQSSSIVIRSLAVGLTSERRPCESLRPEVKVGALVGIAMATISGSVAFFWYCPLEPTSGQEHTWMGSLAFAISIALGMVTSVMVAALSGTAGPLFFKRCGFDPSAMSGPMETAFQDIIGGTVMLMLAGAILRVFGDAGANCPGGSLQMCVDLCKLDAGTGPAAPFSVPCVRRCVDAAGMGIC